MANKPMPAISLLYCYAYADRAFCKQIDKCLVTLKRSGQIKSSYDGMISLGSEWQQEIKHQLSTAQIVLLLVSPDFMTAYARYEKEMKLALKRHEAGDACVVPIILHHGDWKTAPFRELQVLPVDAKPIEEWSDHDQFFVNVATGICKVVDEVNAKQRLDTGSDNLGSESTAEAMSSYKLNQSPPTGKYNIHANEIKASVLGDNFGTVNNHGLDFSEIVKLREMLQDKSTGSSAKGPGPVRATVDIGIIIALKEEFTLLYNEIGDRCEKIHDDETDEYYYRFEYPGSTARQRYQCVVAFAGEMGSLRAGLLTQGLIKHWNPHTMVMLGIAASLDHEAAKIGDVVVASQVDAYLENAKANPAPEYGRYKLEFSGDVYRTSSDLLKAVRHFDFVDPEIFRHWQAHTQNLQQQLLRERRDELINKGVLREQAQVVEGHLASGPIVGASQAFIKWLKTRDRKYLVLEMEAAGLTTAIYELTIPRRTLVLRAISDYGDEDKRKLDSKYGGVLRRYAMCNAIQLLWSFFDAGLMPYTEQVSSSS